MKTYIFDIGGVLINFSIERLLENIAANYACDIEKLRDIFRTDLVYQVETGKISSAAYFQNWVSQLIPNMSYEQWIGAWMNNYSLNQPGIDLLEQVKNKGYRTAILSNLAEHHQIAIERKFPGFFDRCEVNFLSYEMGLFKPEPGIYHEVCRVLHQTPADCVFFDDMLVNVNGALKAGMTGIHFQNDRVEKIRHELCEPKAV